VLSLLKNLFGGPRPSTPAGRLLVGVWSPTTGDPHDTLEYRADGTVRLGLYGGRTYLDGRYRFVGEGLVLIDWDVPSAAEPDMLFDYLNDRLAKMEGAPQMRLVRQTTLRVEVTPTELRTRHADQGATGLFRRVA
jgi:hypothetical protein